MTTRSPEAAEWHRLYDLSLWRHPKTGLRAQQLRKQPLCERCLSQGIVELAAIVHHRVAHKGDKTLFCDPSNLASSCAPCHDIDEQRIERGGHARQTVDADGWPNKTPR